MAAITAGVIAAGAAVAGVAQSRSAARAADKNARRQLSSNDAAQVFIEESLTQAREDALKLFPAAEENARLGFQGALDVFGQTIPQQLGAFQSGNVAAQQQLAQGLPQFQRAILGQPVDFSQFQPQQLDIDTSFAQQELPQGPTIEQALEIGEFAPEQPQKIISRPGRGGSSPGRTARSLR